MKTVSLKKLAALTPVAAPSLSAAPISVSAAEKGEVADKSG